MEDFQFNMNGKNMKQDVFRMCSSILYICFQRQ